MSKQKSPPADPPDIFTGGLNELMRLIGAGKDLGYSRRVPGSKSWSHEYQIGGHTCYTGGVDPPAWIVVHLYASRRAGYSYIATYEQECFSGIWLRVSEDLVPESARNYRKTSKQADGDSLPDQWGCPTCAYDGASLRE